MLSPLAYSKEWYRWVLWQIYFSLFENSPRWFSQWLHQLAVSPTACEDYFPCIPFQYFCCLFYWSLALWLEWDEIPKLLYFALSLTARVEGHSLRSFFNLSHSLPSFYSPQLPPHLPSLQIHCSSIFLQKSAGLPVLSTEYGIKRWKNANHKASLDGVLCFTEPF